MPQQIRQVKEVTDDGVATRTTRVIDDTDGQIDRPAEAVSTAARIVWYIAGVILVLLAFRFALILLGANPANGFAHFIYSTSYPFAAPFFGLFSYRTTYGVSRLELSTLVAMAVYALVAYGIARLLTIRHPDAAV